MKFSCSRCGQRYASVDEPEPGRDYRVTCVACGGVLLLGGAAFPALPASEPAGAQRPGRSLDLRREAPLSLALAPAAVGQPPPARPAPAAPRPPAAPSWRWLRLAAALAVALVTAGAAAILLFGGPTPSPPSGEAPSAASRPKVLPGAAGAVLSDSAPPLVPEAMARPSPSPSPPAAPPPAPAAPRRTRRPPAPVVAPPVKAAADGALPETDAPAAGRPGPEQMIADAVAARRGAFEACVRRWLASQPGQAVAGRRLELSLTVSPSGAVTSPRIDDPALDESPLGECLRSAAGKPFPAFEGDPIALRLPLRLVP